MIGVDLLTVVFDLLRLLLCILILILILNERGLRSEVRGSDVDL